MSQKPNIPDGLRLMLDASAGYTYYPLAVALMAFISTTTFAFPFSMVLIPAVLITPRRWLLLSLLCGIASGAGGAMLVEVFHFMGRELVLAHFPYFVAGESWQLANRWLESYGLFALVFIAGLPIPQTPAIFLYSLANPSAFGAMLAIGLGKTMKYLFVAWLTARYPARFIKYR